MCFFNGRPVNRQTEKYLRGMMYTCEICGEPAIEMWKEHHDDITPKPKKSQ